MASESRRVLLDWSLAELEARSKFKELQENYGIEFEETANTTRRRPFLSKIERVQAAKLPENVLKKYFKAGEFIHIPMTREERSVIDQFKRFHSRKATEMSDEDLQFLTE